MGENFQSEILDSSGVFSAVLIGAKLLPVKGSVSCLRQKRIPRKLFRFVMSQLSSTENHVKAIDSRAVSPAAKSLDTGSSGKPPLLISLRSIPLILERFVCVCAHARFHFNTQDAHRIFLALIKVHVNPSYSLVKSKP